QEKEKCTPNDDSPVLFHKVSVAKKGDNVYSVTNTGPMVPLEGETLRKVKQPPANSPSGDVRLHK
ncbi:hypothetical protein M514_28655, partial [Trichuris suis]